MTKPDGERIAVLEVQMTELIKHAEKLQRDVSEMKDILQQAKGAKWLIVVGAAVAGAVITYLPWVAKMMGLIKSG